jgi:hypothetical protein
MDAVFGSRDSGSELRWISDQTNRISSPANTNPPNNIHQSPVSKPRSRPFVVNWLNRRMTFQPLFTRSQMDISTLHGL